MRRMAFRSIGSRSEESAGLLPRFRGAPAGAAERTDRARHSDERRRRRAAPRSRARPLGSARSRRRRADGGRARASPSTTWRRSGRARRELALVAGDAAGDDRLGREPRRQERLVDPVARERIDEPGGVADEEDGAAAALDARLIGSRLPWRSVRPHVDAVLRAEPAQVLAQARPLRRPAADAEVRVARFREDPAVPAGDDAKLTVATPCCRPAASFPSSAIP